MTHPDPFISAMQVGIPPIGPPQPLDEAQQEAVEGLFSEGDRDE